MLLLTAAPSVASAELLTDTTTTIAPDYGATPTGSAGVIAISAIGGLMAIAFVGLGKR